MNSNEFVGDIKVSSSEVLATNLVIRDPGVVASFASLTDSGLSPLEHFGRLLVAGIAVEAFGSNHAGAEKLEASVGHAKSTIEDVMGKVETSIKKQVDGLASPEGALAKGVDQALDTLREQLEELTAGQDSPFSQAMLASLAAAQRAIREDIKEQVTHQKQEIATLLDPAQPTSPLRSISDQVKGVAEALNDMKQAAITAKAVQAEVVVGTRKGLDYEADAVVSLQIIAGHAGDDCEATGNSTGRLPRNKMGDAVVDLKVGTRSFARLVMEAKNSAISKADWEHECKGSMENRAASGFIGMCKNVEDMPNGSRLLILNQKAIVLAFDPEFDDPNSLQLVYQMVKMATLSDLGQLDEISIAEVNTALATALEGLKKFDNITKSAAAITNAAKAITDEAGSIRRVITEQLNTAQIAIARGSEPEALPSATTPAIEE